MSTKGYSHTINYKGKTVTVDLKDQDTATDCAVFWEEAFKKATMPLKPVPSLPTTLQLDLDRRVDHSNALK